MINVHVHRDNYFYNDAHLETIARDHPAFLPTHTPKLFFIREDSPCSFSACGNLRFNLEGWLALFSFCAQTNNNKRRGGKGIGGGEGGGTRDFISRVVV